MSISLDRLGRAELQQEVAWQHHELPEDAGADLSKVACLLRHLLATGKTCGRAIAAALREVPST